MSEYRALPAAHDQAWLLEQLAGLVAAHGATRLVTAPLVEPDDRFFPDRWDPTPEAARALLSRLLRYAGMGRFDVALSVDAYSQVTGSVDPRFGARGREGAAAWFAGIARRTCFFGLDESQLSDAEGVAGALAHEVAHAWRGHHGLVSPDRALEEELTDITTVYLGFGVLTANASSRHRSAGRWAGGGYTHEWSHARSGYLPPEAMSFLLAAYCVARGFEARDRDEIAAALEANQAASFVAAWRALDAPDVDLRDRLGVPAPSAWPDPLDAQEFVRDGGAPGPCERALAPAQVGDVAADPEPCAAPSARRCAGLGVAAARALPADAPADEAPADEAPDAPLAPRAVRSWAPRLGLLGGLLGALAAHAFDGDGWAWAAAAATVGAAVGRAFRRDACGDRRCGAALSPDQDRCPRCGALVLDDDHPWLPLER